MGFTTYQERSAFEAGSKAASTDGAFESQINIKGERGDIERFRHVAKRDGLRLIGLLRRALDAYEEKIHKEYHQYRQPRQAD